MKKKEKAKRIKKVNWAKLAAFLTGIIVIINVILITNIRITLPLARKVNYFGELLDLPISFTKLPLKVSPFYFTEIIIKRPESINFKKDLKFSIRVKEKGKKLIKSPEFKIFVIDSIGQLRSIYPPELLELINYDYLNNHFKIKDKIERENLNKGITFKFKMPPEDQKVLGTWKIFVYLFNYNDKDLVSYVINEFDVIEWKGINPLGILFLLAAGAIFVGYIIIGVIKEIQITKIKKSVKS